jgi:hypothetical protein
MNFTLARQFAQLYSGKFGHCIEEDQIHYSMIQDTVVNDGNDYVIAPLMTLFCYQPLL